MAKTLFDKAVSLRASDIHIRVSKKDKTRFFFRIHNDLEFQGEESYEIGVSLCSTIYQAMSDVSDATFEMMSLQDARISDKSKLPNGIDGIRIATSPQVDGQIMVLRLLYNDASESTDIEALGYTESNSSNLTLMRHKPSGINLIGGPTGSGKSTTLQRLLVSQIKESEGK
jgi:type II secretory ATPase GspE/PulE/Tfp pilus assembly ATPase PilB-like protein